MMQVERLTVRVARRTVEAEGVIGFELVPVDGRALPSFDAGAHVDVHVPGIGARQYSLCNAPGEAHRYLIGVLREAGGRGGSVAMHDTVREGSALQISPPKNRFPLNEMGTRSVLFAGGIGVTPILAMAERLAAIGADFEMHYCTRTAARTAYSRRLRDSVFAGRVNFYFDDGPPERKLDLLAALRAPQPGTHLYVCGPNGFMNAVVSAARECRWDDGNIHLEHFAGAAVPAGEQGSFEVVLKSSGRVIRVDADRTVADALNEQGIAIALSCQQGVCGTCITRVLEGEIEHRDLYLTPEERARNDQFLPCCSRARSPRLVLDL